MTTRHVSFVWESHWENEAWEQAEWERALKRDLKSREVTIPWELWLVEQKKCRARREAGRQEAGALEAVQGRIFKGGQQRSEQSQRSLLCYLSQYTLCSM